MLIDWFTVVAQVFNFLILVWLMKRFLYKPILDAIDARESRIADKLSEATATQVAAEKQHEDYRVKNETFDHERAELLTQAKDEAKAERERLFDSARSAADAQKVKSQEALEYDVAHLDQVLGRRVQTEVFAVVRKTLSDLANNQLEQCIANVFIGRLLDLDSQAKKQLSEVLKATKEPVLVCSAFDFSAKQQVEIQNALNKTILSEVPLRFKTTPELVCGIELSTTGHKLAWSITHYLGTMEKSIGELLKVKPTS